MARPAAPARPHQARLRIVTRRAATRVRRSVLPSEGFALGALCVTTVFIGAFSSMYGMWVPPGAAAVPVLVGGLLLGLRSLYLLLAVVAVVLASETNVLQFERVRPDALFVVLPTAIIVLLIARARARLGVQGTRGESMLVDLRDRLRAQGEMPSLPPGWEAEVVLRSAGGASFSGDFLVSSLSRDGTTLEVALVDVSGKGVDAGTRALLLSGAFGGLLGAMPGKQFLPAANAYLLRQEWEEGFATAAHLVLHLDSGDYEVSMAGHPPAAHFVSSSGRWEITGIDGPLLGVFPDAEYVAELGRLLRGDALLLYTDGLIEVPGRDISVGIDRLLGEAERLVTRGFRHGARKLVDSGGGDNDDRALVLIWRT